MAWTNRRRLSTLLLVLATGLAVAAVPTGREAHAEGSVDVLLLSPGPAKPVFGKVEIAAEVLTSEAVSEVVFLVDGREVGRLEAPPYKLTVDIGQDNLAHRFEVVARTVGGAEGRAVRNTPPIPVDEEMDLELQQLYVTVTENGQRVRFLAEPDFTVFDDGTPQRIVTFEQGDVPLTAALLVDASTSMRGKRLAMAVEGAKRFVEEMKPLDEAMLLLFSDRLLYSTPFTTDPGVLSAALGKVTAQGGTAINDLLYLALKRLEARQGRRVVVLLTDGIDVESTLSMEDVQWMARRSQALIYWIRIREAGAEPLGNLSSWRNLQGHRKQLELLEQTVTESGGRIREIDRLEDADKAFHEILAELREQYVLGYYPSSNRNDGAWHKIRVEVRNAGVQIRTRDGYIDF